MKKIAVEEEAHVLGSARRRNIEEISRKNVQFLSKEIFCDFSQRSIESVNYLHVLI